VRIWQARTQPRSPAPTNSSWNRRRFDRACSEYPSATNSLDDAIGELRDTQDAGFRLGAFNDQFWSAPGVGGRKLTRAQTSYLAAVQRGRMHPAGITERDCGLLRAVSSSSRVRIACAGNRSLRFAAMHPQEQGPGSQRRMAFVDSLLTYISPCFDRFSR